MSLSTFSKFYHRKLTDRYSNLSNAAFGLYAHLVMQSGAVQEDGRVAKVHVDCWARGRPGKTALKQLIDAGIVTQQEDGSVIIEDYLDEQVSAAQIKIKREGDRARQADYRARRQAAEQQQYNQSVVHDPPF